MAQIECPFCGAYATKIPGPTLPFHEWEQAVVAVRKAAFWALPLDTKLGAARARVRELESEVAELDKGLSQAYCWFLNILKSGAIE